MGIHLLALPFVVCDCEVVPTIPFALWLWSFGNTIGVREKMGMVLILPHVIKGPFGNEK
jgi:hypothetical protein